MALEIRQLSKNYGTQKALDGINLHIEKGEIVGLLGPNGAGKSTLMKTIAGVLNVQEGEIIFGGLEVSQNALEVKKKIGFLPENNPLYTEMYVKEYFQWAANIHKISASEIDRVIDWVGISPEKHKKIRQLSKGYRQRVGLGQAILAQPELIILDEPTNGLDPNQIIEIREIIREIGKNKTVILSTHIMQEVEALCSRVVLIHRGKIIQDSSIDDFKGKYTNLEEAFKEYTSII